MAANWARINNFDFDKTLKVLSHIFCISAGVLGSDDHAQPHQHRLRELTDKLEGCFSLYFPYWSLGEEKK